MKIFQIGFNRCGTLSLCDFFNDNGHKAVHYDHETLGIWEEVLVENHRQGLNICDGYDDIVLWTDIDFIQRQFQALACQYPESKFIYNVRPIENWIDSRLKFYGGGDVNQWKAEWYYREKTIKEFFQGRNYRRLLKFDIENDTGEDIANFLPELEWKDTNFPHSHKTN